MRSIKNLVLALSVVFAANAAHAQFSDVMRAIKEATKKQNQQQGSTPPVMTDGAAQTQQPVAEKPEPARPMSAAQTGAVGTAWDPSGARFGPTAQAFESTSNNGIAWVHTENTVLVTSRKPRSLQDAQSAAITEIKDGDPLWLYIKTARPIAEYIRHDPDGRPENQPYEITIYMGTPVASGGRGVWENESMGYPVTLQEMKGTELAIPMAPRGVKAATSTANRPYDQRVFRDAYLFLSLAAHSQVKRGVYSLAFYVRDDQRTTAGLNWAAVPQLIGAAKFTMNVPDGLFKYKEMKEQSAKCQDSYTKKISGSMCILQQ